jgi:ribosomal protein S14
MFPNFRRYHRFNLIMRQHTFFKNNFMAPMCTNRPAYKSGPALKSVCLLTRASRSIYKSFGISRHMLRIHANHGYLPAIIPSSW